MEDSIKSEVLSQLDIAFQNGKVEGKRLAFEKIGKLIDEQIDYLENHVKIANTGIKINVERVESWIFAIRKLKKIIKKTLEDLELSSEHPMFD